MVSPASPLALVEIVNLTSDLPVSGDAACGSLSLASLKVCENSWLAGLHAPLTWQAPVLSLNGITFTLAGKLAFCSGLPMLLDVQLPKQAPAPLALPAGALLTAQQLTASGQFRGLLLAPATWLGDCFAQASAISITESAHHAAFDSGSCQVALRGGVLSCPDARAVGDDLSLLGNATLFADGRAAAVIRLVAAPATTLDIVRRLLPANAPAPSLTPMNTPQRAACDLELSGNLCTLQVQLGHNGPILPLP